MGSWPQMLLSDLLYVTVQLKNASNGCQQNDGHRVLAFVKCFQCMLISQFEQTYC